MKKLMSVFLTALFAVTAGGSLSAMAQDSASGQSASGSSDTTTTHMDTTTNQPEPPEAEVGGTTSDTTARGMDSRSNRGDNVNIQSGSAQSRDSQKSEEANRSAQASAQQSQKQQDSWKAYNMMAQTHLAAAEQFAKGLDRQLEERFPISEREARIHSRRYSQETLQHLQDAKKEIAEISTALSRDGFQANEDFRKHLQKVNNEIDTAIRHDRALMERFANASSLKNKSELEQHVSKLQESLKNAQSAQKDIASLNFSRRSEKVGEM